MDVLSIVQMWHDGVLPEGQLLFLGIGTLQYGSLPPPPHMLPDYFL